MRVKVCGLKGKPRGKYGVFDENGNEVYNEERVETFIDKIENMAIMKKLICNEAVTIRKKLND